jgi:hypothetical protein
MSTTFTAGWPRLAGVVRRALETEHEAEHWSERAQGGHFPAKEEPVLLTDDLRSFFRPFQATTRTRA